MEQGGNTELSLGEYCDEEIEELESQVLVCANGPCYYECR